MRVEDQIVRIWCFCLVYVLNKMKKRLPWFLLGEWASFQVKVADLF